MSAPAAENANRLAPAGRAAKRRSMTPGDAPESLLGRYLVERQPITRSVSYFRDHRETAPRFVDAGRSLHAKEAYPDAVRDMLQIARHRGWGSIKVTGDDRFRREVWLQGQALGLQVRGHRPTERDRQAAGQTPIPRGRMSERLDQASVVVRALISDPAAQARLMARALARAAERDREASDRDHARSRDR